MKAIKVELLIINHDELEESEIRQILENTSMYPNDCMSPSVMKVQSLDIGEYEDGHPLTKTTEMTTAFAHYFSAPRNGPGFD